MTPWPPPPPRGVKWSNWHRIQDLFIRPIRSALSSVPAGRPGRAVLRVCHVYNIYVYVCVCVGIHRARDSYIYICIYSETYFYGLSLSLTSSVFSCRVFVGFIHAAVVCKYCRPPSRRSPDHGEFFFSSLSLYVFVRRPLLWFQP